MIFSTFAQNIDCGYTLEPPLTSTHNLCFRAKIRKKKTYPCKPQFYHIKVGCKGVYITRTCYPDGKKLGIGLRKITVGPLMSALIFCEIRNKYLVNKNHLLVSI